ncbi:Hypothetical_protein [Hexamita inflata]|uniref:Hypothetical_protein n=1 Tax=Hexamita inflata TaxID=28002 RepID=A0AA86TZK6_9EUKA|nr:Hypothetical protein HINF_LOCUS23655 [Hexamita inflata]CAI9968427.1 Hypothetical protein HINF_LOCUS56072 [Hexamita inflata]
MTQQILIISNFKPRSQKEELMEIIRGVTITQIISTSLTNTFQQMHVQITFFQQYVVTYKFIFGVTQLIRILTQRTRQKPAVGVILYQHIQHSGSFMDHLFLVFEVLFICCHRIHLNGLLIFSVLSCIQLYKIEYVAIFEYAALQSSTNFVVVYYSEYQILCKRQQNEIICSNMNNSLYITVRAVQQPGIHTYQTLHSFYCHPNFHVSQFTKLSQILFFVQKTVGRSESSLISGAHPYPRTALVIEANNSSSAGIQGRRASRYMFNQSL